jgi:hypothetical protein
MTRTIIGFQLKVLTAALTVLCFVAPAFSPAEAVLSKTLRFWVYEKTTDVVNDVTGLFDSKAQKITLKCELKNLTDREIHGVRGTLRFTTFFGEKIADISIETTAAIPPGQVIGVNWNVPTDRLSPDVFEKLKKAKLDQMKQVWYPSMIAFTDGTVLK